MGTDRYQGESMWDRLRANRRLESLEHEAAASDPALTERTIRERIEFYGVRRDSPVRRLVDQALDKPIPKPAPISSGKKRPG
jgi:hypothetical protein